ncbi:MAG: putative redox protein [Arenicella sp.]|jgi:putative redox protein
MKLNLQKVQGKFGMQAFNEEGQYINFDGGEAIGGAGFGVRPMEAVAASLAACASIDVLLILDKQRIELSNYEIAIDAVREEGVPGVFSKIHLTYKLEGSDQLQKIERAVELSMTKYCSVSKILEPTCQVTYSVELN